MKTKKHKYNPEVQKEIQKHFDNPKVQKEIDDIFDEILGESKPDKMKTGLNNLKAELINLKENNPKFRNFIPCNCAN